MKNFRPDYGRCRPLGMHCTLRGNHLYSTPEVTEEHEIGKQLKHHSAREALGTEKSSCFRGEGLYNIFEQLFFSPFGNSVFTNLLTNKLCSIKLSSILDRVSAAPCGGMLTLMEMLTSVKSQPNAKVFPNKPQITALALPRSTCVVPRPVPSP